MTEPDRPSSSTTRPSATAPRARTSPCRLADKLRIARMLDEYGMPYIEGGWPGSNPKDIEFFKAARAMTWQTAKLAAFGSTRHRVEHGRGRPEPARARRGRDAGRDDLRQELAAPRHRGPRRDAAGEPRHDRGLGRGSSSIAAASSSTTRSTSSTATRPIATTPSRRSGPPARPARRTLVLCDTNGGTLTDELLAIVDDVRGAARGGRRTRRAVTLGHPHPQRRRARGRQLDGRGRGRRPPRPGDDQRLRRARRQREHGLDPRQPRAQDAARARAGRRRRPRAA